MHNRTLESIVGNNPFTPQSQQETFFKLPVEAQISLARSAETVARRISTQNMVINTPLMQDHEIFVAEHMHDAIVHAKQIDPHEKDN